MYTLAFDTTGRSCSIVLLRDNDVVSEFEESMDYGQSEVLLPQIKKMLEEHKIEFSQLDLIAVCDGPGSFTGVRSSISAARTFNLACPHIPVSGVSAFEAYLCELKADERAPRNVVLIETKREDFYYQIFDEQGNKITEPSAAMRQDILDQLKGGQKVSLVGDGVERFLNAPSGLSLHSIQMPTAIDVRNVGFCALRQYHNKRINFPKPLYLRAPDVCVK